jgi:hypothetical protein
MTKIIIRDNTVISNLPVAVLTMKSDKCEIIDWIERLKSFPDKYELEMVTHFVFDDQCSNVINDIMCAMLHNYAEINGRFEREHIFISLAGICQGFAFSEERKNSEIEGL